MVNLKHIAIAGLTLMWFISLSGANRALAQQGQVWKWPQLEQFLAMQDDTLRVVNFWATWCRPCLEEMPLVLKASDDFASKPVRFLLVSLDFVKERETKLLPFLSRKKWKNEVVLLDEPDYNSWLPKVSPEWEGNIPCTLLVKGGKESVLMARELKGSELENAINLMLSK